MVLILLTGCKASGNHRAPIEERDGLSRKSQASGKKPAHREPDSRPQFYVIQKGDTLYSIAFEHGLDYREVAEQNNIENPAAIQIGQQIKLLPSEDGVAERPRIDTKPLPQSAPAAIVRKDQPKVYKLPYSDQAIAKSSRCNRSTVSLCSLS